MKKSTLDFLKLMAKDAATFNANMQHYRLLDGIRNSIQEAWESWDDETTKEFWENEAKPTGYTQSFAEHWIDNEDFEADGYDENAMDKLFADPNEA
jgi:hypothetical protein